MKTLNKAWMALIVLACVGSLWAQATRPAPTATPAEADSSATVGSTGAVTGNDVYVRSGFSTNYYPVIKLHRGDQVTVLRSQFGWLEITPPPGVFSLIEKSRVDKSGDTAGVVNDTAQVYAGSDLNSDNYAKQVRLSKGDTVRIIGETAEGDFYKIAPPPGATVWINADFVKRGGAAAAGTAAAAPTAAGIEPVKPGELSKAQLDTAVARPPVIEPARRTTPAAPPAPRLDPTLAQTHRDLMRVIEAEIADEMRKSPGDQNLEPIVGKLHPMAEQTQDITAQVYAKTRIEQLKEQMELAAAVVEMKQLREEAISRADEIKRMRDQQRLEELVIRVDDIAARGEIRVSALYNGTGGKAKRWRLVDPKTSRTIAYFELAAGSTLDPVQFYGKYVGVRATSYQLLHGTVPPLPVYVVTSIEVQDPAKATPSRHDVIRREALASPEPRLVDVPASQPSVSRTPETQPAAP